MRLVDVLPGRIRRLDRSRPDGSVHVRIGRRTLELLVQEIQDGVRIEGSAQALGDLRVGPHVREDRVRRRDLPHPFPEETRSTVQLGVALAKGPRLLEGLALECKHGQRGH